MTRQHIHFIGICGVAMGSLALAFKRAGYHVTGSDVGFYPPMSTYLKNEGIEYYPGWHPEKMIADGQPDFVIVGNVASSTNPEWLYTQENQLKYLSYPEAITEFFVKEKSVVCAGTYGKTTSVALLSFILTEAGLNPNYMFGGLASGDFPSAKVADSNFSVLEGDEYKSARWDNGAKFFHYRPTHLLLTAVEWDHADVYPTADSYYFAFDKLINELPAHHLLVVSENVRHVDLTNKKTITYGKKDTNNYYFHNVQQTPDGIKLTITHHNDSYQISSVLLGEHQAENICGAFAMAHQLGINPTTIAAALNKFPGLKRRLEKRGYCENTPVYDDIAHSPNKASSALASLKAAYPEYTITAIFEPNTGNRQPESAPQYADAFKAADEVIIPELTKIKIDLNSKNQPWEGEQLSQIISTTHPNTKYIPDDNELIKYLKQKIQPNNLIVFLGSHGFRGMIEAVINKNSQ